MRTLHLPQSIFERMTECSRREFPREACGILGGRDDMAEEFYPALNREGDPRRYRIDPAEQVNILQELERRGWRLVAIFHSHPKGDAFPSPLDKETAYYPEAVYLILSLRDWNHPELRGFSIKEGKVEEVHIRVIPS